MNTAELDPSLAKAKDAFLQSVAWGEMDDKGRAYQAKALLRRHKAKSFGRWPQSKAATQTFYCRLLDIEPDALTKISKSARNASILEMQQALAVERNDLEEARKLFTAEQATGRAEVAQLQADLKAQQMVWGRQTCVVEANNDRRNNELKIRVNEVVYYLPKQAVMGDKGSYLEAALSGRFGEALQKDGAYVLDAPEIAPQSFRWIQSFYQGTLPVFLSAADREQLKILADLYNIPALADIAAPRLAVDEQLAMAGLMDSLQSLYSKLQHFSFYRGSVPARMAPFVASVSDVSARFLNMCPQVALLNQAAALREVVSLIKNANYPCLAWDYGQDIYDYFRGLFDISNSIAIRLDLHKEVIEKWRALKMVK